ncbi:MAG: RIP metalloprotease RseP [Candidatus Omnitrophota bacterium]|nr:MAG: RIP metalloprotease RseP [Candidatus Omnitrophota bacterium]
MSVLAIIIIFSILIVAHEFGHFLAARMSGVAVEKFSIGFGPKLFRIKGKETEFLVCLFPLGGYVKLAGDSRAECSGRPFEFLSRSPGIKMRIVFAGPLFNYLLAFMLFWLSFTFVGFPSSNTVIGEVLGDYPAYSAGIREGDKVLEVNNEKVGTWHQMAYIIHQSREKVLLKIERNKEVFDLEVPLKEEKIVDEAGKSKSVYVVGIAAKVEKYNPFKAFFKGMAALVRVTVFTVKGLASIIIGKIPFKKAVAGPLGIFYFTHQAVQMGIITVINLTILLNINLAIVNLFPLPILDGGHVIIFFVEKLRKKPLNQKAEDFLTRLGFILIGILFIFIFYNDIIKFGPKLWGKKGESVEVNEGQSIKQNLDKEF